MLLSHIQIKRAKPKDKSYTLNDGMGLSLLIDTAGSKGWRYRYRFAGKPKMISFAYTVMYRLHRRVLNVMKLVRCW